MQNFRYIIFFFLLTCLSSLRLSAQHGIQLANSPRITLSQWQQPAFLATQEFQIFTVGLGGAYDLGNSSLPIGYWPLNDNFLDEAEKEDILSNLDDDNRFSVLAQANLLLNFKLKKKVYSLGFRQRSLAYTRFQNPDVLGLVLRGNASYAGQTVADKDIKLGIKSYSELSFGTAGQKGNWGYGIRIKLLGGNNYTYLDLQDFALSTTEFGTSVSVISDFEYDRSRGNGLKGFGAGLDLGATYQVNEKILLQASVIDAGFISWSVNQNQNRVNTTYQGAFIEDITNLDLSDDESIFSSDSLERLFFPDTSVVSSTSYLPGFAQLGMSYQLSERSSTGVLLRYGFNSASPMSSRLQASLIFQHHINPWLKGGIHATLGGLEGVEAGAMLAGDIPLGKNRDIQIFCQADKLLGLIVPEYGKGQGIQVGVIWRQ